MIGGVQNIGRITELRQRIFFTFAMLAVYRIGAFIVTPGINAAWLRPAGEAIQPNERVSLSTARRFRPAGSPIRRIDLS